MQVTFTAGTTAAQQAMVNDAIASALYPWSYLSTAVEFNFGSTFDPALHGGKAEAYTDLSGLPGSATVHVNPGILEPGSPYYAGYNFALETIVHELGHVITFQLTQSDQQKVCQDVGGDFAKNWTLDETHGNWQYTSSEAVAEIFKDIYLPRDKRAYDNRTKFQLYSYQDFINTMADAEGGGTVHNFAPQPSNSADGATSPGGYHPTTVWAGVPIGEPLTDSHGLVIPWSTALTDLLRVDLGMVQYATPDTPDLTPDQIVAFAPDHFNFPTFFLATVPGVPSSRPPTLAELEAVFGTANSADITPVTQPAGGSDETWWVHGEWPMSGLPVAMPSDGWLVWGTQAYTGDQTTGFLAGVGTIPPVDFTFALIAGGPVSDPGFPYGGDTTGITPGPVGLGVVRGKKQGRSLRARLPGMSS